jgi:hypothetical protein
MIEYWWNKVVMLYKVQPRDMHRTALKYFIEGGQRSWSAAMIKAGYSPNTAKTPAKLTKTRGFQELLDDVLADDDLMEVHQSLLKAKAIDHLVFPLSMSDEEITELVEGVGGTVRKFKHGDTAVHCWFWAPNTKARQDALKLAYDLKGKLGKRDPDDGAGSTYNTFIGNNTINPNTPTAKELVENSLDMLMKQTKRKVVDV